MLTYFLMHLASSLIRACSRRQGGSSDGEQVILQTLSLSQWAWKVFPVAAASGLEVRPTALGLQYQIYGVKPHLNDLFFILTWRRGLVCIIPIIVFIVPWVGSPKYFLEK